jgi:hypothetical protein
MIANFNGARKEALGVFLGILGMAAFLAMIAYLLSGCVRPPVDPVVYGAAIESCLQSAATCPEYVACRRRVAASYGREYLGRCK